MTARMVALCALVAAGMSPPAIARAPMDVRAIERAAHDGYVAAINSNDLATFLADLTLDVVYQSPGEPEIVGKAAVGKWASEYLAAYRIRWEKRSIGFTVAGDWAFERYTYRSTDADRKTGAVTIGTGKGINIFRHDRDGKWRVAVDGWSSDGAAK